MSLRNWGDLEPILRQSYGKAVAHLLRDGHPLHQAEDAVSAAIERALNNWPTQGLPRLPDAWLTTVAKRIAIDNHRRDSKQMPLDDQVEQEPAQEPNDVVDERLRLFFLCAHPAIDSASQTPLMLQLILGFTADQIADLYLVPAPVMSQRLVRSKRKIRDSGILPHLPKTEALSERTDAVLQALYGAYGVAWEQPLQPDQARFALEIIELTRSLISVLPSSPEVKGLLALVLFCEARRSARRSDDGRFIPLDQQDPSTWNRDYLEEAEVTLQTASKDRQVGRFQLESAIQSAHTSRRKTGSPDWKTILALYDGLIQLAPSAAVKLGRIAAYSNVHGAKSALMALDALDPQDNYQPYWALRGHLLEQSGNRNEADEAKRRAHMLTPDASVAEFLLEDFSK